MKRFLAVFFFLISVVLYSQNVENDKISEENRTKLIDELSRLSGTEVDKAKIIVLNFYLKPEKKPNGSCIDHYTNDSRYKRFIKKQKNVVQFFVTEQSYSYRGKNILEDKNGVVKNIAFEDARLCGNYIIIFQDGEVIRQFGEYRQDEIPKLLEKYKLLINTDY